MRPVTPVSEIRTAVILFPDGWPPEPAVAQAPIAGVPILQRQLLWLGKHGIEEVYLMAAPDRGASIGERIQRWRRIPRVTLAAGGKLAPSPTPGRAVVLDARFLHHPDLLTHALSAPPTAFAYADDRGALCGLGVVGLDSGVGPETLAAQPRRPLPAGCFAQAVESPAHARQAERLLLRSFIKQTDGWYSRHLNRPVSLWITRRIAHLPVHPNAVTIFSLLLGVLSGWCAAQGTFLYLAAGGVLFQIASILDGVDGELARAKLLHSKFGEWLDTVCDDSTNALFIAGVTLGAYRMTQDLFWLCLGGLSLVVYGVTLFIMYGNLIANKRKPTLLAFQEEIRRADYRPGRLKAGLVALQPFIKRDFYGYAFMICCLLSAPKVLIGGWSIGAILTLGFIASELKLLAPGRALKRLPRNKRGS
jgi:phosphatidylglycerophosphate synthase